MVIQAATFLEDQFTKNGKKELAPPTLEECGPLACVLHGDCWNNNMMYRYDDDGKVVEMKLVDWQVPRVGHPATDVINFLITSTSPEIRKKHRRSFLNHYYDVLSSAMDKLGLELYSRGKFFKEIHSRMLWGMFFGLMTYPGIFNEKMVADMEEKNANKVEADKKANLSRDDVMNEVKESINVDQVLSSKLLCDRIVDLVESVKNAVKNDDWMFIQ
jgi:hypothetical protein